MKEENKFRFFEVSFYIMAIALVGMVAIVLYYIAEKPKTCVSTQETIEYDINHDGIVDVYDLLEETKKIEEIQEKIINEN
jgi:hypothetical protein